MRGLLPEVNDTAASEGTLGHAGVERVERVERLDDDRALRGASVLISAVDFDQFFANIP